jgi:ribose transport system substrate-binding protein
MATSNGRRRAGFLGRRRPSAASLAAVVVALLAAAPLRAETKIAVIAPIAGNAFYDAVGDGCRARAAALGGVSCSFLAPGGEEKRSQAEILAALVSAPEGKRVDGIAISPSLVSALEPSLVAARVAGIPVVAFDADLPAGLRRAFVGTNARDFGRALGASLRRWKPAGGRYAVLTGPESDPGLADRVDGVRDALDAGWTEIAGPPARTGGDPREAAALIDRLLLDHPDLDAVVSVGAWPFLADEAWREVARRHKERLDRARTVIVVADALPVEKALVREGLGHVLVGQRPTDMGARLVDVLAAFARSKSAPEIVYVGFDVFTRLDLLRD